MNILVSPSILAANFVKLEEEILKIETSGADAIHIDVMDGHFVPNLTFGPKIINDIKKITKLPLDVHLMIENPEASIQQYIDAGSNSLTIHFESTTHIHRMIQTLHDQKIRIGISLIPSTKPTVLTEIIEFIDSILVMTVNPGFGGQRYLEFCENKISYFKEMKIKKSYSYIISVDGGINLETAKRAVHAGAENLIIGTAFFNSKNQKNDVLYYKNLS